jgi:hypothetical protein
VLQTRSQSGNENEIEMKINKIALLIGFAITAVLFFEVAAHADEANQSTKITFSAPVEIPGQVPTK